MELLQGWTLDRFLAGGGQLSLARILRLGREMALAAAHDAGLIHRDVKPGNIWLEEPSGRTKLRDFGLVRAIADEPGQSLSSLFQGTPEYMAPEQSEGSPVDARSDLFSIGCVLYRLCTSIVPFPGRSLLAILRAKEMHSPPPPHEVNPEVPGALSRLVMQLLARDPEERPASAHLLARELHAIETRSEEERTPVVTPRFSPAWTVGIGVAVLLQAVALVILGQMRPTPSSQLRLPAAREILVDPSRKP
jgi:serine/threonine protein kinase